MGSSTTAITSPRGVCAAFLKASLTSSTVTSRFKVAVKSETEPQGTGTRMAIPSILPSSSGKMAGMARAAPVEVGMMFAAAARARARSLWAASTIRWSLV